MSTIDKLTALFETCHMVYVETNPHHVNRETVTEFVGSGTEVFSDNEVIGPLSDDRTLYRVQVYPSTPISSYVLIGHDLDAILDAMLENTTLSEADPGGAR